jgi:uncharacterized membrane protein
MKINSLIKKLSLHQQEFLYQFESHPDYPSNRAFSDTLNLLGIKNKIYILEKEFWDEIPEEYIGMVDNSFSLVKKAKNKYKVYSETVTSLSKSQLYDKSTNLIILFETNENKINNINKINPSSSLQFYVVFIFIILYSIVKFEWYETLFNILSLTGIFISQELFKQKFGTESSIVTNICGGINTKSVQTSCNKIFYSDKTNILGLKISDISLIYFLTIMFSGLLFPSFSSALKVASLSSVIVILYSLSTQIFVEKLICKVCMIINTILILQLLISVFYFKWFSNAEASLIVFFIIFLFIFLSIAYINSILIQSEEYKKLSIKSMRFKRNYNIFKHELLNAQQINFKSTDIFFIGKKIANIHISLISNPYCRYCKNAHKVITDLIAQYPNHISAQIRFNYIDESPASPYNQLISHFKWTFDNKSEHEFLEIVEKWFNVKDLIQINKISGATMPIDLTDLTEVGNENMIAELNLTPTLIINGYQFPNIYEVEDLKYFIDKLVEDVKFHRHVV